MVGLPDARPAAGRLDHEVRRVGCGQEGRERRRGPAGGRQRPERDASGEADQEDEHQIARALAPPADDRPVPGRPEGRVHASSLPERQSIANGVSSPRGLVVPRTPGSGRRIGPARSQPDVGNGLNGCTVTQHVPCGLWFVFSLHCDDGGTLLWILTTWYWVGP